MLVASYIYVLCQGETHAALCQRLCTYWPPTSALDLRALQAEFLSALNQITREELARSFGEALSEAELSMITGKVIRVMHDAFESTSTMDATSRMEKIASSSTVVLLDFFTGPGFMDMASAGVALTRIPSFRANVTSRTTFVFEQLRVAYLTGVRGPAPASPFLNKTRPVYEFIRLSLGIRMHGLQNLNRFAEIPGMQYGTVGQDVSVIHEVCTMSNLTLVRFSDAMSRLSGMANYNLSSLTCSREERVVHHSLLLPSKPTNNIRLSQAFGITVQLCPLSLSFCFRTLDTPSSHNLFLI